MKKVNPWPLSCTENESTEKNGVKGELIETHQDPSFIAPPPPPDSDEENDENDENAQISEKQKEEIEKAQIVDPSSFIDFSSLEPPPPPPPEDDDAQTKEQELEEPVYHGDNIRGTKLNYRLFRLIAIIGEIFSV